MNMMHEQTQPAIDGENENTMSSTETTAISAELMRMQRYAHTRQGELVRAEQARAGTSTLEQAQNRTQQAELFRRLVESVRDYAIFMLDPTGCIATWNIGAERIKGYSANEIIGKHFSTFYPDEDVRAGKCEYELEEATREGRFEDEGWRVRKDGGRFWANVVISAVRDEQRQLLGFSKVTRDLSVMKRGQEEQAN